MAAELSAETVRAAREQADTVVQIARMIHALLCKRRRSARDAGTLTKLSQQLDAAAPTLTALITRPGESVLQRAVREANDTVRTLNRIRTLKARGGRAKAKARRDFEQRKADFRAEWLAGRPRTKTAGVEQLHQKHGLSFSTAKKTLASVPFPSHWPARFQR